MPERFEPASNGSCEMSINEAGLDVLPHTVPAASSPIWRVNTQGFSTTLLMPRLQESYITTVLAEIPTSISNHRTLKSMTGITRTEYPGSPG